MAIKKPFTAAMFTPMQSWYTAQDKADFGNAMIRFIESDFNPNKSAIVEEAAQAAQADLILSHPVTADPTDAKGLPWKVDGRDAATFLPYGESVHR